MKVAYLFATNYAPRSNASQARSWPAIMLSRRAAQDLKPELLTKEKDLHMQACDLKLGGCFEDGLGSRHVT